MSRRRKNAGEGYGYMFHGAFSKKADAVAKERKTKGAWVKGTPTNNGYRYIVMSPRTNPRKRNPVKVQVFHDAGIGKFTATTYHQKFGNVYASGFTKKEAAKNLRDRLRAYRNGTAIDAHRGYAQNPNLMAAIRHGDRVTIVTPQGQKRTGRAVMRSATGGWVLNMGGQHGTPGIATEENTVQVKAGRRNPSGKPEKIPGHAGWVDVIASNLVDAYKGWRRSGYAHADAERMTLESSTAGSGAIAEFRKRIRESNPSELLVMAANPHGTGATTEHLTVPAGTEIIIRTNPAPRENSLGTFLGFSPAQPNKKDLAESRRAFKRGVQEKSSEMDADLRRMRRAARSSQRQSRTARVFHEVYGQQKYGSDGLPINPSPICGKMIGGYECSRKPGHKGPHLPQGATMRTRKRLPHAWQPRQANPSAEALRETFTGARVSRVQVMQEPHMPAGDYALLGKLLSLYIKPCKGGQVIEMKGEGGTILVADESARQIYFVGGDQDLSESLAAFGAIDRGAGIFEIGEARRIDYRQRKEHVPHPESDSWRHDLGEENGIRPTVLFDRNAKRLLFEGGDYRIEEAGIIN